MDVNSLEPPSTWRQTEDNRETRRRVSIAR